MVKVLNLVDTQGSPRRLDPIVAHLVLISGVREPYGSPQLVQKAIEKIKGPAFAPQLLPEKCVVLGRSERNHVVVAGAPSQHLGT